jgi:hypothetical protein
MNLRTAIVWVFLMGLSGCASTAVRPPSPAREMSLEETLEGGTPNDRYYIMVFGSQQAVRVPRFTHTWVTMVKVTSTPGCAPTIEERTISWFPASLVVRPFARDVEPGVNLGLHETIVEIEKHHEYVSMWGPFETWHGLWKRFVTQEQFLETGALAYQCSDSFGEAAREGNGCNCFHAVTDMDPLYDRRQYPLMFFGNAASNNIVRQISERPLLIHPGETHDWLIGALGLETHSIVRRSYHGRTQEFSIEALVEEHENPAPQRRRLLP